MKKGKDPFEKFRSAEIHLIDPLDKQMRQIEYESADTLRLLADTEAPEYFSTKELVQMRDCVQQKLNHYKLWQVRVMALGVGSAIGFAAILVFGFLKLIWLALLASVVCVVCFSGFYGGLVVLKRRFESRSDMEFVRGIIQEELKKRRYGFSIGERDL